MREKGKGTGDLGGREGEGEVRKGEKGRCESGRERERGGWKGEV